jgi:putative hydrolase of the HAD superfamily
MGSGTGSTMGGTGSTTRSATDSGMDGTSPTGVEVVLFDLGGVLVHLGGGVDAMQRLAGLESADEVWKRWLTCEWVRSFERGGCSPDEFAQGVVADWGLAISPADFLEQFRAWPEDLYEGARELVEEVRQNALVGCLSNTNQLHWTDHYVRWDLDRCFDLRFLSFELGMVKPDRELFEHVARTVAVAPERIAFLDDNQLNVDQAAGVGFNARRVRGPAEALAVLTDVGVVGRPKGQ